jgi:hypothetical protein
MKALMKTIARIDFVRIFKNSIRLYFAPLTGSFRGVRKELRRIDKSSIRGAE